MYEKNIFCYFLCGIFEVGNFEIGDIFHFGQGGILETQKPNIIGLALHAEQENQGRLSSFLILNYLTCYSHCKSNSSLECTYLALRQN